MATDITVSHLIINELTQAQYNEIEKKDDELYFITDLLPSQNGQNGKFLTTNGINTAWGMPSISLSSLSDCTISNPTNGQMLQWNGSKWINTTITTGSIPSGSIIAYAGSTVPSGYLICDGAAVSRSTYSTLYNAIGTTYGAGDGNSTFNLPNLINRFLEGGTPGTLREPGLPNITGNWGAGVYNTAVSGAVTYTTEFGTVIDYGGPYQHSVGRFKLNAALASSVYGNSETVQPKSIEINYCIKY